MSEIIEHTLPEEEQCCTACGNHLHVIGKNIRETLKLIPAKAVIERHIQYVYGCRYCEKNACETPIVKAPTDTPLISGSIASAEAVAQIINQKFVMGVPLYRQEQEWSRQSIALSRQIMSNWLLKCTEDYLTPIYDRMHEQLIQHEVLHADETTLQVLHEEGKPPQTKSYMWLYRTSLDVKQPIELYGYHRTERQRDQRPFSRDSTVICMRIAIRDTTACRRKSRWTAGLTPDEILTRRLKVCPKKHERDPCQCAPNNTTTGFSSWSVTLPIYLPKSAI